MDWWIGASIKKSNIHGQPWVDDTPPPHRDVLCLGWFEPLTTSRNTPTPANIYPIVHRPPPVPRPNMKYVPASCLVLGPPASSRELTLLWMRPSDSMLPDRHCFCDPPAALCDRSHLDSLGRNKSASHNPSSLLAARAYLCPGVHPALGLTRP